MNPKRMDAAVSATELDQTDGDRGRTIFKALLLVSTLLSGGLLAVPADAGEMLITTTGTILSGSETGGLFGLGATGTLSGTYTLSVNYDYLGPNYFTSVSSTGSSASDFEFPGVPGPVIATVNGHSVSTALSNSLSSNLAESLNAGFGAFQAGNNGFAGASSTGAFVTVSQNLSCGSSNNCVPVADLMTPFLYDLIAGDNSTDLYTFNGPGFPGPGAASATFVGTETSFEFQVPEPESWALLATGLLGLGLLARRRRA